MYATPANFLEHYQEDETTQLSNQDDSGAVLARNEYIQTFLNSAEGEVLPYLGRYTHPIPAPPAYLIYAICAVARKQMERNFHRDQVVRDYDDVIRWLKGIAAGNPLMRDDGKPISTASPEQSGESGIAGGNMGVRNDRSSGNYSGSLSLLS